MSAMGYFYVELVYYYLDRHPEKTLDEACEHVRKVGNQYIENYYGGKNEKTK